MAWGTPLLSVATGGLMKVVVKSKTLAISSQFAASSRVTASHHLLVQFAGIFTRGFDNIIIMPPL